MVEILTHHQSRGAPHGEGPPLNKMKREDFACSQADREKLVILARAHGVTKSECLRMLIREEFRKPRLRSNTPIAAVIGIIHNLCNKHRV